MIDFLTIIKNKKFLELWISQILSQVTVNIMNFVLLVQLFSRTGSAIATSLLWVSYALPAIFFGPIGAVTVDLFSRRKMLMVTNLLQALVVFGYIFLHNQSYYLIYGLVLMYSFLNQFYTPAEAASLPSLVESEDLPHANSLFFIIQQASLIIGFGVAGILLGLIGFKGSLILCSIGLFIAFISVSFLPKLKPREKISRDIETIITSFYKSIIEGYRFIKSNKQVLFPLLLLIGLQVALAILMISVPVLAREIFDLPINLLGSVAVVPAGLGALLGSLYVSKLLKTGMRKRKIIEICLLICSAGLFALGLLVPFIPSYLKFIFGILITIILGFSFIGINIPALTFLQEVTPHDLRGRVFGNMWFIVTIVTIFPVLFSGVITELFGVKTLITLISVGCFSGFLYSRKWKYLYR